jgi:glycosyltransferase involved in cell wall biosynthesis
MVLPPRDQAQRELGLEGRFVVTLFGFIARKKGHLAALEAMRDLPEDVTLLIAGGKHPDDATSYVREVEERARELSVRARITGYLPADKIPTIMAATDLALAPFIETSGSASLAIAFASGRPIVASDIQPHREILQDTEYSLQLAAPEPGALARTILEIRHDARALERLRAGSAQYAKTHSMARTAEETVCVYREALAEVSA